MSYSRTDAEAAKELATQLEKFGREVWLDSRLSGGQPWWDSILDQIRRCDCFVFAQSESSLRSKACRAELEYAHDLGKPILPVEVGAPVPDGVLPRYLAEAHRLSVKGGNEAVYELGKALADMELSPPLPDPLPDPPPVPISYIREAEALESSDLSKREQWDLVINLKQLLTDDEQANAARSLLQRLRKREDLYAAVATEIDQVLVGQAAARTHSAPPSDVREFHTSQTPLPAQPPHQVEPTQKTTAPVAPQARTSGLAVSALVLGILWIYGLGSILAIVLGSVARKQIDRSGGGQTGRGMATAGIVLGWIGIALVVLAILAASSENYY